ncbi:hypothetical protein KC19_6G141400 [Ceratodon purpureus]|uniref:Gnk2-homologous domain-containing protein n=1 Tax=Ceratodon purpureus TaxID=3225 RepID=A0A8T0HGJ9_CERPU|nr:hypothetical protein KC19_6G141400 [Ceratodon purpureus]
MVMAQASVVVLAWLMMASVVAADYTCSKNSTVLDSFTFDFLRTFQKTGAEVKKRTFDEPNKMMNFTMASKDTRRNVTMWAICNSNNTERAMCSGCIGILINGIYELCCEQRASWGTINLRTDCSIGYTAPDYVIQGWTDPGDLPKEVLKEPEPIDFDATHTIFRTHRLYLLVVLVFCTLFCMC